MNKGKIAELGLQVLKDVLVSCGGWPVLEGPRWIPDSFDWENLMFAFNRIGFDSGYLVEVTIGTDLKNNSIRGIQLDQPSLGLSRDFILQGNESQFVQGYFKYMIDVAVELGCEKQAAERELKESLDFEIELAKISSSKEERRNITMLYNVMTIAEIQERFSGIQWLEYLNSILHPHVHVNSSEAVNVVSPRYISSLIDLLSRTPKRVQANYAMWRVIKSQISYLTEGMIQHQLNFHRTLFGVSERPSRWKECVEEVSSELPILTSALYVRKYFDNDAKSAAHEMVTYIKESFHNILLSLDWMDEQTRKSALDKAALLESHIGYPDELLDDEILGKYHETLKVDPDEYFSSHLNIQLHSLSVTNSGLREAVNKTSWIDHSNVAQVNAFYNPLENSIMVPAGILQGTYFHKDRPRYMNFAAIGSVIGHEITHGFDDTGKQFDKNGIFTDWWDQKTQELFLEKTQCIIDQYNKYTVVEVNQTVSTLLVIIINQGL
uniref:Peptidase M13 N-terminal domain-containing protein n=1 Tax=Photinus pyralis TaxID=7054 RepID=A0A1Y1M379_PHOPY